MISVVIPCYNGEKTIKRCVMSILNQSESDFEIVIVDDGSTDSSGVICDNLSAMCSNVQVLHQENTGLMNAWKNGVKVASGEYICFVDCDDWIDSDMLERINGVVKQDYPDVIMFGYKRISTNGEIDYNTCRLKETIYNREEIERIIFPHVFGDGKLGSAIVISSRCCKAYNKDFLISRFDFFDNKVSIGEDDIVTFVSILSASKICFLPNFFPYNYNRHDGSMMGNYNHEVVHQIAYVRNNLISIATFFGYEWKSQIDTYFLDNTLICCKKIACDRRMGINGAAKELEIIADYVDKTGMLCELYALTKNYNYSHRVFTLLLRMRKMKLLVILCRLIMNIEGKYA